MTIRAGDKFRDDSTTLQVYGFSDGAKGRRVLVVNDKGERTEVEPWSLMEERTLEPTKDKDALVVFDSGAHA